jgi:uncharacterized protein YgbK (DUF1537 family)
MPQFRVAIVADDLTGACDAAVGFTRAGLRAEVALPGAPAPAGADVAAIDIRSRHLAPRVAADRTARWIGALRDAPLLIKKLDSTLRGNVRAELEAALRASGRRVALVAPAFPAYGRTTRDGVQYLDGVPVHEGVAGADPVSPARTSDLGALLGAARLRRDQLADTERIAALTGFVVADAETGEDLDTLVAHAPRDVLWAGSTGLSQAFGRVLEDPARRTQRPRAARVVVAVGSLNPLSRRQLDRLRAVAGERVTILASPPDGAGDPLAEARALGAGVLAAVRDGADAVVLTGGDTAAAALAALGATGFAVLDEVEPGVPVGRLRGPFPVAAVTKAGGFGSEDALVACVRAVLESSVACEAPA